MAVTQVSRNDLHAKQNLVRVTLDGVPVLKDLVFADSSAGIIHQEVDSLGLKILTDLGVLVSSRPLVGQDRYLAVISGTVVITVLTLPDQTVVVEQGRPTVAVERPPSSSPWAQN